MVRRKKKAPVRKAKAAPRRKAARKTPVRKPTSKKRRAKKRVARKRVSAVQAFGNAVEVGIADLDEVAVSMGLLGAVEPAANKRRPKKS